MIGNNTPLISVIIPLYNAEKYIAETIESVINQTYTNWEMIIVDDCSTDNSTNRVKEYVNKNNKIKLIESKINFGGPARPRNIGVANAKGKYIAFLDADDVWLAEKLEKQVLFLEKNQSQFVSCSCKLIDEKNNEIHLSFLSKIYNKIVKKRTLCDVIKNNFILTSSVLVNKDLLKEFNEEKKYIAVEDFELWLQILVENKNIYKYQNEELLQYRVLDSSISNRKSCFNQELKANLVLANFIYHHEQYIGCYYKRIIFNFAIKYIKRYFK